MSDMVSIAQVFEAILSIAVAVGGWFIKKIFEELKLSRNNERELYQKLAQTREDMLQMEITRLRSGK